MNPPSLPSSSSSSSANPQPHPTSRDTASERPTFIDPFASSRRTNEAFYAFHEPSSGAVAIASPPTIYEAAALGRIRSSSSSSGYSPSSESVATPPSESNTPRPLLHPRPRPSAARSRSSPQVPILPGGTRYTPYQAMSPRSIGAGLPPVSSHPALPPPYRHSIMAQHPPPPLPLFTRQPIGLPHPQYPPGTVPAQTPPSSALESALEYHREFGKGRKGRTPTACKPCNQNKIGCNRTMPCDNCVKKGIQAQCKYPGQHNTWASHPRARGPNKRKREVPPRADQLLALPPPRRSPATISINSTDDEKPNYQVYRQHPPPVEPVSPFTTTPQRAPEWTIQPNYTFPSRRSIGPAFDGQPPASTGANLRITSPAAFPPPTYTRQVEESHERTRPTSSRRASDPVSSRRSRESLTRQRPEDRDTLMEYSQPPVSGATRPISGFLGSSHFGPESAQKFLSGNLSVPMSGRRIPSRPINASSQLDETKPYSLVSQVRELLGIMPSSKEVCDRYVERFFDIWNSHVDFLYRPDFDILYASFWTAVDSPDATTIDLRHMALIFVILAFGVLLDHDPKQTSQMDLLRGYIDSPEKQRAVDEMLRGLRDSSFSLEEREGLSLKWSWGARRALTEANSFYGDSLVTVKATGLLALYLISCRRVTEGWKMTAQAINSAQAQGMHQDGSKWNGMSPREAEIRRRLWAQLYILDRSVSLYLGRPVAIVDGRFTTREPSNLSDMDLLILPERHTTPSDIPPTMPPNIPSLDQPTKSTFLILHFRLAQIIGQVQDKCFGLHDRDFADVVRCEQLFQDFRKSLPAHWWLDKPDTSLDHQPGYEYLKFQRLSLISKFHLARVTLHRPYITHNHPETAESRKACLQSSVADLTLRTSLELNDPLDRFKWLTVASGFNSATVIGVMCIWALRHRFRSDDVRYKQEYLLGLLERYIEIESRTVRQDEKLCKEIEVLQYMVAYVKNPEIRARSQSRDPFRGRGGSVGPGTTRRAAPSPHRRSLTPVPPAPIIPASQKPSLGALLHNDPDSGPALSKDTTPRAPSLAELGHITLSNSLPVSPTMATTEPPSRAGSWSSSTIGPAMSAIYQEPSHTDPTASVLPVAPEMGIWESTIHNIDEGTGWDFEGLADLSIEVMLGLSGLMSEPAAGSEGQAASDEGMDMQ